MAIDPRSQCLQRIVHMNREEIFQSDHLIKFRNGMLVAFLGSKVISSSKSVTSIQTDSEHIRQFYLIHDPPKLIKAISQIGPLPCRGFKQEPGAATNPLRKDELKAFDDSLEPFMLSSVLMSIRMEKEVGYFIAWARSCSSIGA